WPRVRVRAGRRSFSGLPPGRGSPVEPMLAGVRTIDWVDGAVEIVDQTALPGTTRVLRLSTVDELVAAVRRLAVRGAPAIGVAGALGVALAARLHTGEELASAVHRIETARPTAVNLARGARRVAARLPEGPDAALAEALAVRDEEIASSAAMARLGADLVTSLCGPRPRLLTHCNTGALATVVGGTALSGAFALHGPGGRGRGAVVRLGAGGRRRGEPGVRRDAGRTGDGDRHRPARGTPGPRREAVGASGGGAPGGRAGADPGRPRPGRAQAVTPAGSAL